jgi:hypothetical protein
MKSIPHYYESIQGWFSFSKLYSHVVQKYPNGSHFIEVGVWKGTSASYMGVEIYNSGKNIKFDCIDPFVPVKNDMPEFEITHKDLKNTFINNMKPLKGYYNLILTGSPECTELYKDKSVDFVFIDGDHSYSAVMQDIKAWLPKMKPGSILAGHDYAFPEVRKACHDVLGEKNWSDPFECDCWMVEIE